LRDPIVLALPALILILIIEAIAIHFDKEAGPYDVKDASTSIANGLVALIFSTAMRAIALVAYTYVYLNWAPWKIPMDTWWAWVLLFIGVDFLVYVYHCGAHRFRLIWAGHQVHHSSEHLNTSVAFRRKWSQWFEKMIWFPLPLLGFPPLTVFYMHSFHLLYGVFAHTERVRKLPRWIEYVFVTPSHHRVHHGTEKIYIDKNMGSILIIWDRIFGTFQPEVSKPTYGLLKQVDTHNIWRLQTYEFVAMIRDVKQATKFTDKLMYVFGRPSTTNETLKVSPEASADA
jgi:sterol desaturase/sphingolipid hydroxylase (fatty acid hydroxylase superfamily)